MYIVKWNNIKATLFSGNVLICYEEHFLNFSSIWSIGDAISFTKSAVNWKRRAFVWYMSMLFSRERQYSRNVF